MRQDLDKEHLLKLTLAVYKVTAIFPAGEELCLKIRESADSILAEFLLNQLENGSQTIKEILGLFDVAKKKNWIDSRNFLVLRREYGKLFGLFGLRHRTRVFGVVNQTNRIVHPEGVRKDKDDNRQDKILAIMNGNGAVRIGDLVKLFPGVNRRTVLRDLDKLCHTGAMARNGIGRGAYYIKNGHKCDIS